MPPPRLVTLTTDIGSAYAAQMKAVLYRSLPPGHVVDLTHDLPAHRIAEAAFVLQHAAAGFPAGTVHVAIVDPGVGSERAPLVLATAEGSSLVGPDNGVLAPLAAALGGAKSYRIDWTRLGLERAPSATFEGRDLFAPTAALLALGRRPSTVGPPVAYRRLVLPVPRRVHGRAVGMVLHIDRFGNLITNVPSDWLPERGTLVRVRIGPRRVVRLPRCRTYSELGPALLGVIGSSFGTLEVAVREGSAAERLRATVGERVELTPEPPGP